MVARNIAGPGVILSFIIAALASIFSGKQKIFVECSDLSVVKIYVCFNISRQVLATPSLEFGSHIRRARHICIRM